MKQPVLIMILFHKRQATEAQIHINIKMVNILDMKAVLN